LKHVYFLGFILLILCIIDNCFTTLNQDIAHQVAAYLYNYSTKECLHFNYLVILHYVDSVQMCLILFYALLFWFESLMMVPCGLNHVGIFGVIL